MKYQSYEQTQKELEEFKNKLVEKPYRKMKPVEIDALNIMMDCNGLTEDQRSRLDPEFIANRQEQRRGRTTVGFFR